MTLGVARFVNQFYGSSVSLLCLIGKAIQCATSNNLSRDFNRPKFKVYSKKRFGSCCLHEMGHSASYTSITLSFNWEADRPPGLSFGNDNGRVQYNAAKGSLNLMTLDKFKKLLVSKKCTSELNNSKKTSC